LRSGEVKEEKGWGEQGRSGLWWKEGE